VESRVRVMGLRPRGLKKLVKQRHQQAPRRGTNPRGLPEGAGGARGVAHSWRSQSIAMDPATHTSENARVYKALDLIVKCRPPSSRSARGAHHD